MTTLFIDIHLFDINLYIPIYATMHVIHGQIKTSHMTSLVFSFFLLFVRVLEKKNFQ